MYTLHVRQIIAFFILINILIVCISCSEEKVTSPQKPPMAEIASPDDGDEFLYGETINFQGTAIDPEDGILIGNSLVWTSNRDGQIGKGTSFNKDDLSANK